MSEIYIPESPSIGGRLRRLWRSDSTIRHKVYAVAALVAAGLGYLLTGMSPHRSVVAPMAGASITPITNVSGGASGISFSGDAYDVSCTASAATGTMYPALYDGSAWTIYYSYPCSYDGSVVTKVSCIFPARRSVGGEVLTWNAFKTGSATLSSCTAQQRYNGSPFPSAPSSASSSSASGLGIYGDGSDGDVSISGGTTTLSRDMFYNTLTVTGTGILKTARYRVYAKTAIVVEASGSINDDGNAASGSTQGGALTATILGGAQAGRVGGTGAGTAGANITNTFGGAGGAGGAGSGGAGGAGGTATVPGASFGHIRTVPQVVVGALVYASGQTQYTAGVGGGSGGGNGSANGGGGGGGGGNMVLVAKSITNSGTISARGGAGGAGAASNCGGGGGGGGGVILITTGSYTGTAPSVTGGAGGASGGGTGVAGSAGSTGFTNTLIN